MSRSEKPETKVSIRGLPRNPTASVGRAVSVGGGLDFDLTPKFSVRVVEVDYIDAKTFGSNQKNLRVSTGLIFRFGKK